MGVERSFKLGVTLHNLQKADDGYTLFGPNNHDAWLIDIEGRVVNRWRMPYSAGCHGRLLPNGHIIWASQIHTAEEYGLTDDFSGLGGLIQELDWDGNLVWESEAPYQGHDFQVMDNGHILYICFHPNGILPDELAAEVKGGLPGTEQNGKIWGDCVMEIDRQGKVVWEWLACEHLDPKIDTLCPLESRSMWPYLNSLCVCQDGNILLSTRYLNQITKIEYPSGRVLNRYLRGRIFHQHDVRELPNGNIMAFDNGLHRYGEELSYSRVVEFDPSTEEVVWEYKAEQPSDFYSAICGGSERLANGNTLICDSVAGRVFEVTPSNEIVWEYVSPFMGEKRGLPTNRIWRAHRYSRDYTGFKDHILDPTRFPWENLIYGPHAFRKDFAFTIS